MKNNRTNILNKLLLVMIMSFLCIFSFGTKCYAEDEIEEWEESGTVLLDKVHYKTKTRELTVEITETSGQPGHEYELYMLVEGELADAIGRYLNLGKILSILGIMTVDMNDTVRIKIGANGKITIADQDLYFGNNEAVTAGTKVLIGVESLDENYNGKKSNLIELTIGEDEAEAGAMNANGGNNKPDVGGQGSGQTSSGSGSLLLIIAGVLLAAGAAAAAFLFGKKNKQSVEIKPVEKTETEKVSREKTEEEDKDIQKPSIEDKSVFVDSKDEQLIKTLKGKSYLEVSRPDTEEDSADPDDQAVDSEPHLYICDVNDEDRLNDLIEKKKELLEKVPLGLVLPQELIDKIKEKLEKLKEDKQIIGYVPFDAEKNNVMIKLILPILKPDLKSEASLENIGKVCDLLGIEGVSTVISTFISGRDIKSTIEDGDLGFTGTATIISDVASILGMDTVASVAGVVGDIDSISSGTDSEAGAYEKKNAILGAKDIVDVITDLADKA